MDVPGAVDYASEVRAVPALIEEDYRQAVHGKRDRGGEVFVDSESAADTRKTFPSAHVLVPVPGRPLARRRIVERHIGLGLIALADGKILFITWFAQEQPLGVGSYQPSRSQGVHGHGIKCTAEYVGPDIGHLSAPVEPTVLGYHRTHAIVHIATAAAFAGAHIDPIGVGRVHRDRPNRQGIGLSCAWLVMERVHQWEPVAPAVVGPP